MEKHPPAYLSASRLSCYDYCPAEFHKRYILKHDEPPTPERLFGTAVHKGLEAHFLGQDDEIAFLREWRTLKSTLTVQQQSFTGNLQSRGLELLEMVRNLNLSGEPERIFHMAQPGFKIPFMGYLDLWDEASSTIVDFKTTGYGWTQQKADAQIFQPALYSQAISDAYQVIPTFTFIVLPRIAGPLQIFDGTRTGDQIIEAFARAKEILDLIEDGQFDCRCGKHEEAA